MIELLKITQWAIEDSPIAHCLLDIYSWYPELIEVKLPPINFGNHRKPGEWGYLRRRGDTPICITLSPLLLELDRSVLRSVLWHEICHVLEPPIILKSGRRSVHHKTFRTLEALDPFLEDSNLALREYAIAFRVEQVTNHLLTLKPQDQAVELKRYKRWFSDRVIAHMENQQCNSRFS